MPSDNVAEPVWSSTSHSALDMQGLLSARIWPLIFIASLLFLIGLGLPMVYSATVHNYEARLFWNQIVWLVIASCIAFGISLLPFRLLVRYSFWALLIVGCMLFYLALAWLINKLCPGSLQYFPMCSEVKGAVRWLRLSIGSHVLQIQPSEFAKVCLLLFLAAYYGTLPREEIKKFVPGILLPGCTVGAVLFLILMGKDLSSTVITGATCLAMMFYAGVRIHYLLIITVLGLLVGGLAIKMSPERLSRMTSYRNPEAEQLGDAFQLWRSQLGMGGGGLKGRGFSKGVIKTFLPEAHTDFIVAVIGEELGFLGVSLVFFLYLTLSTSIVFIARQCRGRPEMLLCLGIATLFCMQALINIGVVSGWCPTTGVTAPFLSYGGSSLMVLMICSALVIKVSMRNLYLIWQEIAESQWHLTYKASGSKTKKN
ncbi:MAG: FtsW/RodA/SpoVE family cell cycle protein [Oligosphaeraceae bacterium]|nr:FtsW/RodA/SpoVE family cell cycle protein [Oligosphaeraceae bacterium]